MAARCQPGFKNKGSHGNHRADEGDAPDGEGVHNVLAGFTRRAVHGVALGGFKREAEGERGGGGHVHPQNQHRRQRNDIPRQQGDNNQQPLRQVGRHDEQNGLLQVVVDPTPLFDRTGDGGKVVVGQDHVGSLFGHLGAFNPHGDPDVGLAQRRGVVDAVAGHANHFTVILQRFHQAQLVLRAGTGKDIVLNGGFRQLGVVHVLQLIAGHRLAAVGDPQHLANAHRRLRVVAGNHLHADPRVLAGVNSVNRFRTRRVHHSGNAEEHQTFAQIVVGQRGAADVRRFVGGGDHTQALTGKARHLLFPVLRLERHRPLLAQLLAAQGKNHVRCAGNQHLLDVAHFLVGRHVLILRVERYLRHQAGIDGRKLRFRRQHLQRAFGRPAGNAPQAALVLNHLAVVTQVDGAQIGFQHAARFNLHRLVTAFQADVTLRLVAVALDAVAAVGGDDRFDGHLVHRQGAGFIRAHHGHGAQGFHRRQLADNRPLTRHRLYTQRENNRDNRR